MSNQPGKTLDLEVVIPNHNAFYTLFADGPHSWKTYAKDKQAALLTYARNAVIILYYTYPTHREACVIRNTGSGAVLLPGLSKKVSLLFSVHASRVDKLKRAVGYLNKHAGGAYTWPDDFYIRLLYLIEQRGKINYTALGKLAEDSTGG